MKFRNDINFLRALSVLVVMLFHFQVPFFGGGFIGVDVFFVISGFLMTQIILKGLDNDSFSLIEFYIKRIRRIVPAILLLLTFVLLISTIFFFDADIRLNSKYALLSQLFVSNIYYWKYLDYFSSHDNILLHTWSLGVEWQFYMVYPLLILLIRNVYERIKNLFWIILIILSLFSFVVMLFISPVDNNFAFYMLPTRFWELSIGGLAFFISNKFNFSKYIKVILIFLSIVTIVLCVIFISPSFLWPSIYTPIPVLATVIILSLNFDSKLFRTKLVKFLGNTSYSLYLWHWPIFVFFQYFGLTDGIYIFVMTTLSLIMAYLSYHFVESKKFSISTITVSLFTIIIISSILFFRPQLFKGISIYQNPKYQIGNFGKDWIKNGKDQQFNCCNCFITDNQTLENYDFEQCLSIDSTRQNILLLGDSHAAQFSASLRESTTYNILEASVGYTFPFLDTKGRVGTKPLMDYLFTDFMPNNKHKLDLVVVSVHWLMNKNSALNYTPIQVESEILQTINYLEKHKINYLIVGQSETYEIEYPKILMLENFGRKDEDFLNNTAKEFNNMLISLVEPNNFVDIYSDPQILRYDSINKIPYMFDTNHFSKFGADQVVKNLILPRIEEKLNRK